jgi:hypothetical protein
VTSNINKDLIKLWEDYLAPNGDVWLFSSIIDLTDRLYRDSVDSPTDTDECKQVIEMYERHRSNPVMKALE